MWGRLARWVREQLALAPDLKHLDDGVRRWEYGDDTEGDQ